jgi:curved DNA-binding protein CbpA
VEQRDPYAVLGLGPDASAETIKSVYRQLARAFHPDANGDPAAVAHFREITDAYVTLSDPELRARYDRGRFRSSSRRRSADCEETEMRLGLSVLGIDLAGLVGVQVHVRRQPLLDDEEEPAPRRRRRRKLPARRG